jgi:hypothetical protein
MALDKGTNAYQDAADALAYHSDRITSARWGAVVTAGLNELALVSATMWLDRQIWQGQKAGDPQALEFPRTGLTDPYGNAVDSGSVPSFIEHATNELALYIGEDVELPEQESLGDNTKKLKAGSAEIEFFFNASLIHGNTFPKVVMDLVGHYLLGASGLPVPFASGTDYSVQLTGETEDGDVEGKWGLNRGY